MSIYLEYQLLEISKCRVIFNNSSTDINFVIDNEYFSTFEYDNYVRCYVSNQGARYLICATRILTLMQYMNGRQQTTCSLMHTNLIMFHLTPPPHHTLPMFIQTQT